MERLCDVEARREQAEEDREAMSMRTTAARRS
jgi:hypothetical protein